MGMAVRFPLFEGFDESAARRAFLQAGKNLGLWGRVGDVPKF